MKASRARVAWDPRSGRPAIQPGILPHPPLHPGLSSHSVPVKFSWTAISTLTIILSSPPPFLHLNRPLDLKIPHKRTPVTPVCTTSAGLGAMRAGNGPLRFDTLSLHCTIHHLQSSHRPWNIPLIYVKAPTTTQARVSRTPLVILRVRSAHDTSQKKISLAV